MIKYGQLLTKTILVADFRIYLDKMKRDKMIQKTGQLGIPVIDDEIDKALSE